MPTYNDLLKIGLILMAMVGVGWAVRIRRRQHARFLHDYAEAEVCEHLKPALDLLLSKGHKVVLYLIHQ